METTGSPIPHVLFKSLRRILPYSGLKGQVKLDNEFSVHLTSYVMINLNDFNNFYHPDNFTQLT